MRRWNVSLAAKSHQRSRGPGSGGGSLCPPRAEQETGAPRDCRAGLPPLNCLGGPVFLPSSAISFGFKHISTGAGSWGWF